MRDFLLRSAVLDRLTGPLFDAVTGNTVTGSDDRSLLLMALEGANLFIVPLDDRREWFRFHHLFADVLRARLSAEQPELVPVRRHRASRWFEQHDLPDEAITHALAARDLDRATYLIELAVPAIRRLRQESVLIGWLRALPEDAVRRSPVLSVYYAFMLMATGDVEGIEPWLDAAERALAAPPGSSPLRADTDDLRTLPATIAAHGAPPHPLESPRPPCPCSSTGEGRWRACIMTCTAPGPRARAHRGILASGRAGPLRVTVRGSRWRR
ncbi:MAG: hypothetical protein L0H96_01890 [Humibacillus sp.]|nr:hypothetical protein [Humibacillus sp.]MDN5775645.1 hypothetical protein [Humibacillus sp.]